MKKKEIYRFRFDIALPEDWEYDRMKFSNAVITILRLYLGKYTGNDKGKPIFSNIRIRREDDD